MAEFTPLYDVVVGSLAIVRRSVDGGSSHTYVLLVVAAAALALAGPALRSRGAAAGLLALGLVVLAVVVLVDRPDTRATGRLAESLTFEQARARPAAGFTLEIAGGVLLLVAGAGLLALAGTGHERRGRDSNPR